MTPSLRKLLFETLYRNKYLYRFASTVPFAGQWRTWQRLVLPRLRGKDVLEIGCGLGDLLADMLDAGYNCHAVESSPQMVAAARETLQKRAAGSPSLIILGQAQGLSFSSASFDTVVSTFPSDYIYEPDTIAEIARVLRPGGRLIVIEGANLLAVGFFQPVLLLIHLLVYGTGTLFTPGKKRNPSDAAERNGQQRPSHIQVVPLTRETGTGTTTEQVNDASFGTHIPLESCGLRRTSEIVRSRRWEVYITLGEKV